MYLFIYIYVINRILYVYMYKCLYIYIYINCIALAIDPFLGLCYCLCLCPCLFVFAYAHAMGRTQAPPHERAPRGRPQRGRGSCPQRGLRGPSTWAGGMGPGPGPAPAHEGINSYSAQEGIDSKGNIIVLFNTNRAYVYI